jgi:hypothetical protein
LLTHSWGIFEKLAEALIVRGVITGTLQLELKKTTCPTAANARLRSANAPLMMPNERRI